MRVVKPLVVSFLLLLTCSALAEPEAEVREAVGVLARSSYAWETTVRQRFNGEAAEPRPVANAAVEARGRFDPAGYTEITLLPTRELAVPATVVFRQGDVVGLTPLGWLRRTDIRQTPGPDRDVDFGGKPVRLSKVFGGVLQAANRRTPTEELFDLLADIKAYKYVNGLVIAELRDRVVETLWGDARAKSAPEIQGTVLFKFNDGGLGEFHYVLAIGFPDSATKKVAWTMQQWSTRITGIGSTVVEPPAEAVKALE